LNPHLHSGYFTQSLESIDPQVFQSLSAEEQRQQEGIELIASENLVSRATLEARVLRLSTKPSRAILEPAITAALKMQTFWKPWQSVGLNNSLNADTPMFSPILEARRTWLSFWLT